MKGDTFGRLGGDRLAILPSYGDPDEARCFADEVMIDFPSVAPAVSRMRRGFLADEPHPRWSTTVRLSHDQVRRGATFPLEVPLHLTCHHCGGRGESWAEPCPHCGGNGELVMHQVVQVVLPAGVLHGDRFRFTVAPSNHTPTRIELKVLLH